ncbi:MAG: biotin--[acetyl-CoA-carboxylase] ligase [Candidatus Omnitrophica bacterium]|nr:biotin--[acetyl-CoA-carboxylase] ligase [Candidatus Omnitrophota bacterium]
MHPLTEKILFYLKSHTNNYVSGEQLSRHFSISRSAIWKHIQELRQLGYEVIAVPHLGYQLGGIPDRLFPYEIAYRLPTKFIGKEIYYFDNISSTMDIAHSLAKQGVSEGTVVIAESQTKARGRFQRSWLCYKYKGIYFSLILKPKIHPKSSAIFTFLSAVAVSEAINNSIGITVEVKWPNDIILDGKKLAGILTESESETELMHYIIIGIGINVNNNPQQLIDTAVSLRQYKKESINRIELMRQILIELEKYYLLFKKNGSSFIIDRWRSFSGTLGRIVKIIQDNKTTVGMAVDVDDDGNLLLRKDSGLVEKINTGDLIYCR